MRHLKPFTMGSSVDLLVGCLAILVSMASTAEASAICRDLFRTQRTRPTIEEPGVSANDPFGKFKITDENLATFNSTVRSGMGSHEPLFKLWLEQFTAVEGRVYRGMTLASEELSQVLSKGMKTSDVGPQFKGLIYTADTPLRPFSFTFGGLNLDKGKNLAVLFEIDPKGLEYTHYPDPQLAVFKEDIPSNAIRRVFIFDPTADPFSLPFVEIHHSGKE